MPVSLSVKSNVKEFTRYLDRVQKKQIPFATKNALNMTVKDCQTWIIRMIPSIFNVTKKWWAPNQPTGIKIKWAKKTKLVARVFTRAFFAQKQEDGGTKFPYRSKNLVIPTPNVPKSRRKAGGATTMLKNKNVFSTKKGIYRTRGGKKRENQKTELLFHKAKRATITPVFGFKRMAKVVALRKFGKNFRISLRKALKTAR